MWHDKNCSHRHSMNQITTNKVVSQIPRKFKHMIYSICFMMNDLEIIVGEVRYHGRRNSTIGLSRDSLPWQTMVQ